MLIKMGLPKTLQWVLNLLLLFLLMFTFFRLVTFVVFHPEEDSITELFPVFFVIRETTKICSKKEKHYKSDGCEIPGPDFFITGRIKR